MTSRPLARGLFDHAGLAIRIAHQLLSNLNTSRRLPARAPRWVRVGRTIGFRFVKMLNELDQPISQ